MVFFSIICTLFVPLYLKLFKMSINYFLYWKVTTAKQINIKAVLNPTTHSVCLNLR